MRAATAVALIGSLLLPGCVATSAVTGQAAVDVAGMATRLSSDAGAVLEAAEARRRDAWMALIASDPSCAPVQPIRVYVPLRPPVPPLPPTCVVTGPDGRDRAFPGWSVAELDFAPAQAAAIQPTIDMMAAVAAYGAALSAAAAPTPARDIGAQLEKALALATRARNTAVALGATQVPDPARLLSSDQAEVATGLMTLIQRARQEARAVSRIRAAFAQDRPTVDATLARLKAQLGQWQGIIAEGFVDVAINSMKQAYRREAPRLGFDGRRRRLEAIAATERLHADATAANVQFAAAADALVAANAELAGLLAGRPSPERRAQAARIGRERAAAALDLLARGLAAWKRI
jgi:hypothetical protein